MPSDPIGAGLSVSVALSEIENGSPAPHLPNTGAMDPLTPTIFHEPWWLNIASSGQYKLAEVRENNKVVGSLPYCMENRLGFPIFRMPTLTYFLGPAVDSGEGNASARYLKRLSITRELISQLPPMSLFKTICHGGVTDVIAFQEEGFRTSVQFTHEIPIQPIEETWKKMRDKTRNCIRRAQEIIKVKDIDDPKQFLLFYEDSLRARGSKNRINARIAVRLIAESLNRQRGRILGATDKSGKLVAAIFCVWDQKSYFYIMSMREESADKGAISLLIWEAIQDAANRSLTFDFTGLSTKGSARFYGGFGGPASPRYIVIRATHLFRILYEFRTFVHKENPFF